MYRGKTSSVNSVHFLYAFEKVSLIAKNGGEMGALIYY